MSVSIRPERVPAGQRRSWSASLSCSRLLRSRGVSAASHAPPLPTDQLILMLRLN